MPDTYNLWHQLTRNGIMVQLTILLARRFLGSLAGDRSFSRLVTICFLSILLVSCACALTAAIIKGFHTSLYKMLQSSNPDLFMQNNLGKSLAFKKINETIQKEFSHEVKAAAPFAQLYGVLQTPSQHDLSHVVALVATDPAMDAATRSFASTIIAPRKPYSDLFPSKGILIGKSLADELGLTIGDTVSFLFLDPEATRLSSRSLDETPLTITGIFSTGLEENDSMVALTSLATLREIAPTLGVTMMGIKLATATDEPRLIKKLQARFNLDVYSWKELYPAIHSAIRLETYALGAITLLIALLAGISIMALMSLAFLSKKRSIALLMSQGIPRRTIVRSFTLLATCLAFLASSLGIGLAGIGGWIVTAYDLIQLPELYYVSSLPFALSWSIALLVIGLMVTMSACAALLSSSMVSTKTLATILKME